MRRGPGPAVPAIVLLLAASGCVDYRIEAPHQSITLARGKGAQALHMARMGVPPAMQQQQWGLFWGLVHLSDGVFPAMARWPLEDVALVTGYHVPEALLEAITLIGHPWKVRVYANVR